MKATDPALVISFRQARAIYYQGKGSLRRLTGQVSILKRAARENDSKLFEYYKDHFSGLAIDAILDDDSEFFHRMESAVKSEPSRSSVPEWEECVFVAFQSLMDDPEIEKLDIQNFAKRWRVINAQRINAANPFEPGPQNVEKAVQKAIDAILEPDWTRIFKRCGLGDLQKNRGGRPKGRQNYLH